jgi:hypothetical protein
MLKLTTIRGHAVLSAHSRRGIVWLLLLVGAVGLAFAWPNAAGAQSGRKRPAPISPAPTPTPEPTPTEAEGESESVPRSARKKAEGVLVSFAVMENDGTFLSVDNVTRNDISEEFLRRLGQSSAISVTTAGRGTRADARDRAKAERETFVVLFQIEEENMTTGGMGRTDPRSLVIRTYVFEPQTGNLKYSDTTYQRPYRESATIGGVRIPVPSGRRIEHYPSQLQLQQAARDAADRLMSRFNIARPPDR